MNVFDKRPLSLILCIMLGGFVFFTLCDLVIRIILIVLSVLLIGLFLYLHYFKKQTKPIIAISAAALIFGILFSHIYFALIFEPSSYYDNESDEIVGDVVDYTPSNYSTTYILRINSINGNKISGRKAVVRLYDSESVSLATGDTVRLSGELTPIKSTNDFDSESYYYSRGISTRILNPDKVEIIESGKLSLRNYFARVREHIRRHAIMLSDSHTGNMLVALLLGERDNLDPQLRLDFLRIGITHILALSGLHLSILTLALERILSLLSVKKKLRYLITIAFVVLYMALTGFSVSVVRAGLMLIISYLLFLCSSTHDSMTSLVVAVSLICFITPYAIFDIALWLSAFATLGVISASEMRIFATNNDESFIRKLLKHTAASLIVSVFAITATYLIGAFRFGGMSVLSVGGTIIFSLLTELIMYIGTFMLIFGTLIPISKILIPISHFTSNLACVFSEQRWVYFATDYPVLQILAIVSTLLFFAFLIFKINNKKRFIYIILSAFIITNITGIICNAANLSKDEISYYSSDNCDIILIKSESETAAIASTQYSEYTAYNTVDVLDKNKITYLDTYLVTHYSWNITEHISTLLSRVRVENVYLPIPDGDEEAAMAQTLMTNIESFDCEIHFIDRGSPVLCGVINIQADFITHYSSKAKLCAVRIYTPDSVYTYLSSGILESEQYPTYDNIATSDVVIFGSFGAKYKEDIYIDRYFKEVDKFIISGDGPYFDQETYARYKENGCEFYSHPQDVKIYTD